MIFSPRGSTIAPLALLARRQNESLGRRVRSPQKQPFVVVGEIAKFLSVTERPGEE
jgi:hypothetical protein